jgi:hypothetical protein
MNDKFQLWSPPKLDLSLDSFSDDLIQQFDTKRHQNVTTVTPPEHNPEREVMETMIASPKQPDYLPHSPVSSSLPSEHDTSKDEEEKDEDEENEGDDDAEVEQEEQEEKKEEETQLDEEITEQRVSNEVAVEEQEHEENASLRKSSSLSQRKVSEEEIEKKTSDEVIAAVSSKVAPPDIKAVSVPEQLPVTPKRRSFFSFRFC